MKTYAGSCHCNAVRFEATLDELTRGSRCNCSICTKLGRFGVKAGADAVRVIAGEDELAAFEPSAGHAQYLFCRRCGAHPFARMNVPEMGGACTSININCLDGIDPATLECGYWDGRHDNWQAGMRPQPWPLVTDTAESRRRD